MASISFTAFSVIAIVCLSTTPAAGKEGFLSDSPSRRAAFNSASRDAEFQTAMEAALGCGSRAPGAERMAEIEKALAASWQALPKNQLGKVEWRLLRYVAHRYFMQQYSFAIRGFEPTHQVNESSMGTARILSDRVPSLVEKLIVSRQATDGFKIEDAVAMIATLEQVIFDAEGTLLEQVYTQQKKYTSQGLSHSELSTLIEAYMVHWFLGDDKDSIRILMRNKTLREQAIPHWGDVRRFAEGMVKTMEFHVSHGHGEGHARAVFADSYDFDDVHEAVGGITKTFASFWETECQTIKASLVSLDKTGTGRIKLADFYGANSDGEWRFGESEAYLRELGALDESSTWRGKQVILTNYLLGASNCIVTTPHYQVCCINECESVLNEIEDVIGAPVALPGDILPLVQGMTSYEDEAPKIDATLKRQLQQIAEAHGGNVPLHGRLFAQWLHYVFPRECPFPHKAGKHTALAPMEFGTDFLASETEVNTHAASRGEEMERQTEEEQQWMSQWSEEEELHGDYSVHLSAPWEGSSRLAVGGLGVIVLGIAVALKAGSAGGVNKKSASQASFSFEAKAHFV